MSTGDDLETDKPINQTKTIDDLFGSSPEPEHNDPFHQLGTDEPVEAESEPEPQQVEDVLPIDESEEDDPFAGIGEPEAITQAEEENPQPELAAEQTTPIEDEAKVEADQTDADRQKYYDDLLAEFEGDGLAPEEASEAMEPAADVKDLDEQHSAPESTSFPSQPAPAIHGLFGEEASPFDDFLGSEDNTVHTPVDSSPAPELSIENSPVGQHAGDTSMQSLFSERSDWMGDTTMGDVSFLDQTGGEGSYLSEPVSAASQRQASVEEEDVDVPEGWIDDQGEFQYYTEEDKLAVRETLLAERAATRRLSVPVVESQPAPYHSENAARRTPQPDQTPRFDSQQVPPSYAPPVFSRWNTGTPVQIPPPPPVVDAYAPAIPTPSPYFTPSQPAGYTASPYDPYAPQPLATTSYSPASSYQAGHAASPAPKPVPPKPQRAVSNAYDPPFLRTQKSFVRPASSAPMAMSGFLPPLPQTQTPPAPAPASLPPSGPPRRVPSVPPAPSRGLSRLNPPIPESPSAYEPVQPGPYDSSSSSGPSAPPASSFRNSGPPSRPSSQASVRKQPTAPNAFDPPLRPPSAARSVSRSAFSPPAIPPVSLPPLPPPTPANMGPSRPSSRGGQKRPGPSFEPPPPVPVKRAQALPVPDDRYRQPQYPARSVTPEVPQVQADSGIPKEAGWPHLSGEGEEDELDQRPDEDTNRSRRQEEDLDPEGGGSSWQDDEETQEASREMDYTEEDSYSAPPQRPIAPPAPPPISRPQPPPIARQASYDPYAPSSQDSYAPHSRSLTSPPTPKQPSSNINHMMASPPKVRAPIPAFSAPAQDPYAPSTSYQPSVASQEAYRPQSLSYDPAPINIPVQPPTPYLPNSYSPGQTTSDLYAPVRSISPAANTSNLYAPGRSISPASSGYAGSSPQSNNYFQSMHLDTSYVPQQVLEQRPLSEDPLGRSTVSAKNAPLAIFGFGGVLVTAFPGSAEDPNSIGHNRTPSYGYASGRGQVHIRPLGSVMELGQKAEEASAFPGPLLLDPSNPKGSAGDKKKKDSVLAYLEARAEEIEKGLPYLKSSASTARREEEGKLLLVRLLSALIVGEGKFSGSPKVEEAIKKALATPSVSQTLITPGHLSSASYSSSSGLNNARPVSSPAQLSALSDMLASGDKRDAVEYAASHGLWSHALVIASSLGPEVWKETIGRFVKEELATEGVACLKASYTLFAGSDASISEDLFAAANITDDPSKDQWREVIASIILNGRPADLVHLDDLAGRFMQRGLLNVAYACSLLSPASPFIDPAPSAFERPIPMCQDTRNEDGVLFAEIAEYARGMIAVPKGQEVPFPGLPALLPYKLQRAWRAAEQGDVDLAKRYCNAIEAASKLAKTGPSLLLPHYVSSLEDLIERLTGSPSIEPAKGLSTRKQPTKPGFDKLGSWIGGRLTTFIAGDDDSSSATPTPKVVAPTKGTAPSGVVGPFSHFSTISPAPSADVSRNTSVNDFGANGNGYLGVGSRPASFGMPSPQNEVSPSVPSGGGYSAWGQNNDGNEAREEEDTTPHADDVGELINPMAALSFGGPSAPNANSYVPKPPVREEEDDEDDLGFGNAGLSRNRTPRPADGDGDGKNSADTKKKEAEVKVDKGNKPDDGPGGGKDSPAKSGGWLKGWWGKKQGDMAQGPGPIKAKLGDENAMVFDKELRRWVVKGQKPEAAPAAPPPPPRSQTVSPSRSTRPPTSDPARSGFSLSSAPPAGFNTMPRAVSGSGIPDDFGSGPRRAPPAPRSGLAESVTADQAPPAAAVLSAPKATPPPGPGGMGRPPGGPPGMARPPPSASIDDLLSRPPSKRPASAASKKGARNRYVDVFQPPAAGGEK